ncbi:hypothetical protein SAMN05444162_2554 [Paenibacillaceae bacterium GAS479]|nr:hypothetical protein SAMN05444162_2554 [Paenibacillaceae bacterium GAS479]
MRIKSTLFVSVTVSALLLAGCGHSEKAENSAQTANQNSNNETANEKQVYIDESQYEGEELALVKLLNQSTKYRNEGDEAKYLALISDDPHTPITQMNPNKIIEIRIDGIGDISDTMGTIQASVTTEGTPQGTRTYVFHKANGQWKIYDID